MRFLTGLAFVLGGLFYIAWPAFSAYQIKTALESGDVAGVEQGIDFPAVRQSMRPAVTAAVEEKLKGVTKGAPGSDLVISKIGESALPKLVETTLDTVVTPQTIIRMHAEGRSLRDLITTIKTNNPGVVDQVGGFVRDLFGGSTTLDKGATGSTEISDTAAGGASVVPVERRLGLGNIKSVGLDGPLAVTLGIARDPKASQSDLTATMSFTGAGWRITGLVPRI